MRRPDVFGKYQLLTRIASGGMAEVWLARSSSIGGFEKLLAIKRIRSSLCDNRAFVSMFIAEAKLTVRLSHPNIVQVFDFGRVDSDYYMAMEYVEGADLSRIAQQARRQNTVLPVGATVHIMHQAMEGLAYSHSLPERIVHRDVSPQNILVSYDGHVKVNDFGIAKAAHEVEAKTDEIFGKLAYVSPEQCNGEPADEASDIWSAGVVLHELLVNRRLFARDGDAATMNAVESGPIPVPSSLNPDIPPDLDELVMGCLERDPKRRRRSARDVAVALTLIKGQHFPTQSHFQLEEVISGLWDGFPPRLLPEIDEDALAQTSVRVRPHGATKDDDRVTPPPLSEQTAAALAEAAVRQSRHVRSDSAWLSGDQTVAQRPPRSADESDLHTRTTEIELERPSFVPEATPEAGDDIDRLKRRFIKDPNLWVLFDIGQAFAGQGRPAAALGAYKLAAAKFAQCGLLVQAACIYRFVLDEYGPSPQLKEEIRHLPSQQGMSTSDLLTDTFDQRDPATDFSEYADIFAEDIEPVDVFHESPILASLNAEQFLSFVEAVVLQRYPSGHAIINEGATGTSFFLLGRGRVVVSTTNFEARKVYITSLCDGDCFGEQGYFTGEPRNATVETLGKALVLEVSKEVLTRVSQEFPTVRESLRRFYKERIAEGLLAKSPLFGPLNIRARRELAERFIFETYADGDLVIRQGDHSDALYAIKSGHVVVYTGDDESPEVLAELGAGEVFGEIAALEGSRRTASVRAKTPCELLRLEAAELNAMLSRNVDIRRRMERTIADRTLRDPHRNEPTRS